MNEFDIDPRILQSKKLYIPVDKKNSEAETGNAQHTHPSSRQTTPLPLVRRSPHLLPQTMLMLKLNLLFYISNVLQLFKPLFSLKDRYHYIMNPERKYHMLLVIGAA